jgi:hypothetical protein
MFFANNITKMPTDIFGVILDNIEDGKDIYNFKNTCKIFSKNTDDFIKPLNVNLFKIKYKIIFDNCDINKHSIICKKMWIILKNFKLYKIHFNRTHNSCKSIFDTQTIIYVSMLTDNINEHKMKLFKLLNENNITNYYISFTITIYFSDSFINEIINYHNKNNNDIIINNVSLQKISENDKNICIKVFEQKNLQKFYKYELDNDKLYIKKSEIVKLLIRQMKNKEKKIEKGILLMENSYDDNIIKNKMDELDIIVSNLNKYRNMMIKLETNILKNQFGERIIRKLETDFELIDD